MIAARPMRIALLAVCLLLNATIALADCAPKRLFEAIRRQADYTLETGFPMTRLQAAQLREQLYDMGQLDLARSLGRHGLGTRYGELIALLDALRDLSLSATPGTSRVTLQDLQRATTTLDRLCSSSRSAASPGTAEVQLSLLGRLTKRIVGGAADGAPSNRNYFLLSILPVLIIMACVLGLILWQLGQWVFSLIFLRRSCKIPAQVHIGKTRQKGHLILLGRLGARFQVAPGATMDAAIAHLKSLKALPETSVIVDGMFLPARLHMVSTGQCVALFAPPLDRRTVRKLLDKSTIETKLQPKRRVKPNLGKINPRLA